MHVSIPTHRLWTVGALAGLCAIAACSSAPPAAHTAAKASSSAPPAAHAAAKASASAAARVTVTRSAVAAPPQPAPRAVVTRVRTADGSLVTVAMFRGPVRYVLHNGSQDPGPAAAGLVRAGPVVTGAERRQLLAAFNGGFKLAAGAGGYMQEGHVISPLRPGFASLVIDRSGRARIGVWGDGTPAPGEAVYSVRQNLQPLVLDGKPTAAAYDWGLWGATLGGGAYVARSALGQDAAGDLSTPRACPLSPPTWRRYWPAAAPGSPWNSTSTPPGSSSTPQPDPAAGSTPRSTASTAQPTSTWSAGAGTSSPSWPRLPVRRQPRRLTCSGSDRNAADRPG